MLDKQFYVYVHLKESDDAVFYVGKGCGYRYLSKQGRNVYWQRIVEKHGFISEIVKNNLTFEDANEYEKFLIEKLKKEGCNLCNMTDGGEGRSGYVMSDISKQKISKKNKGKKRSEKSKAKMIGNKNAKGSIRSIETRKKISESKKGNNNIVGRIVSEETKQKISDSIKKTLANKKMLSSLELTNKGTYHA